MKKPLLFIMLSFLSFACGQKGNLYIPPEEPTEVAVKEPQEKSSASHEPIMEGVPTQTIRRGQ